MAVFRRFIENLALQGVGHKFHIGKMTGVVVGILVPVTVPKLLHKLCRSVSDREGDGEVPALLNLRQGLFQGHIRGIALGR